MITQSQKGFLYIQLDTTRENELASISKVSPASSGYCRMKQNPINNHYIKNVSIYFKVPGENN